MNQVILAGCASYDRAAVEAGVHRLVNGGAPGSRLVDLIKPGMKVLLKPNLLVGDTPEKGITTHPEVVRAVLREVLNLGAIPTVGDSPGFGSTARVAEKTGITEICREFGVRLASFNEAVEVKTASTAKLMTSFPLAKEVLEADAIINLPKMKTHGMARMTGCVKNLYGCIVGVRKAELHFRLQKTEMFMEMLIDLVETVRPVFNIVDAVVAMEGPGPRNGDLRPVGLLLAGRDPFVVDTVIARIMGLKASEVPFLALAKGRGKKGVNAETLQLIGEDLCDYLACDYRVPTAPLLVKFRVPDFLSKLVRRYVSPYPVIGGNCRQCGVCVKSCPAGIISMTKRRGESAVYIDDQKCIRCYCCQELCPHDAIELKVPLIRRLLQLRRKV